MSRLGEWLLRRCSFSSDDSRFDRSAVSEWRFGEELAKVERGVPEFRKLIKSRKVLDYGCGRGYQVARMARLGAASVVGVDTDPRAVAAARAIVAEYDVADRAELHRRIPQHYAGTFDVVLSQNAMEHYPEPARALAEMRSALRSGGHAVVAFGPPWRAPFGAHMHFFTWIPWVQYLFSEATIMRVRAEFADDGATSFADVTGGLNRMTVKRFERLVSNARFEIVEYHLAAVKGLDVLTRVPVLREYVTNDVFAVLCAAECPPPHGVDGS